MESLEILIQQHKNTSSQIIKEMIQNNMLSCFGLTRLIKEGIVMKIVDPNAYGGSYYRFMLD